MKDNERECPNCKEIIVHSRKSHARECIAKNTLCRSCSAKNRKNSLSEEERSNERICPCCKKVLKHATVGAARNADKNKRPCKSCSAKNMMARKGEIAKRNKTRKENNSDEVYRTPEAREANRQRNLGEKNAMYGRAFYEVWVEKYGKETADLKLKEYKEKCSESRKGEKNPMYGVPSPQGSGNGWSGHYKDYYFRSLKELSFIINYIERFKLESENLEDANYKIEYIDPIGDQRNYYGDFLINKKYFVEIKPKKLQETPLNKCKFKAAELFCEERGIKFKLIDPVVNFDQIEDLFKTGKISLLPKYEEKMIAILGE